MFGRSARRTIAAWGAAPPVHWFTGTRWMALAVAVATLGTFVAFMAQWLSYRPLLIAVLLGIVLRTVCRPVLRLPARWTRRRMIFKSLLCCWGVLSVSHLRPRDSSDFNLPWTPAQYQHPGASRACSAG